MPGTPMEIASAAGLDSTLNAMLANEVASELISRRPASGWPPPSAAGSVVGGVVGAGTDAYVTWKIGRYVDREFLPRSQRR